MAEDVAAKVNMAVGGDEKVTIEVEDTSFTMNKALLVTNSEYFRSMFLGPFVEKHLDVVRIEMIRKEDFQLFVDFLERREICWQLVTSDNLLRILDSAAMFRLSGFLHAAGDHLIENWENYGNASETYSMSISYGMEKLTSHMLRLLAKCMDIGFQISMGEMFYENNIEQCVYLNEVYYEYLLHCLQNSSTQAGLHLGSSHKDFVTSPRDSSESRALLEWVLRWILHAVEDNEHWPTSKQIEELLQLCDIEFLTVPDIEETLEQAVMASKVDANCKMLSTIKRVLESISGRTKAIIDNLNLELFCTKSKKSNMIPAFRVRKSMTNICWSVDEYSIPIDTYDLRVIASYERSVFFYRRECKEFWRYHLDTKELTPFTIWQIDVNFISAATSKDHLFCYCDQHSYWNNDDDLMTLPPLLCTFDFKTERWSRVLINVRERYWHHDSNLVYLDGFVYYVTMDRDCDFEVNLVRYEVEKKEISNKRVQVDTTLLESWYETVMHLSIYDNQLLLFMKRKIVVMNPATFNDKSLRTRLVDFETNSWKLLDVKVRDDVLLVLTYPPSSSKFDLNKIHISNVYLKDEKLVPIGFLDRALGNLQLPMTSQFEHNNLSIL